MSVKISFYANRTSFSGDALETRGLGGSESALINLSRAIKELLPDSEITVYNGVRKTEEYKGITYKSHEDFISSCKNFDQDVFISLRNHEPFSLPHIDSRIKILWSQDDLNELGLQDLQKRTYARANVDFFLAISEYAKGEIQKGFPEKRVYLQRNGYNDNLITKDETFYKQRSPIAVYSSTPFRGLDVLTDVWPVIFNECVKVGVTPRLKVFSGMELYGWSNTPFQPMFDALRRMEEIGVQLIGAIPQTVLYRELQHCKVMCYPNHFLETGCMAVLEAIACGVWTISTNLGALNEQVKNRYNGYLIEGDAHSNKYKDEFIGRSVESLCSLNLPKNDCSNLVFTWRQQADNLLNIIKKEAAGK